MGYPPLISTSCVAYPEQIAFRNESVSLTYQALRERSEVLQTKWSATAARRVGVWVDHSEATFLALHSLNQMGVTVVCLRPCSPSGRDELRASADIDHELDTQRFELMPLAPSASNETTVSFTGWGWEDVQFTLQSSGTTGTPKWLPLTTRQLILSAFGSAIRLGHLPGDQWLNVLAPGHMGWLAALARCALYGTTMQSRPFEVDAVVGELNSGKITQVSLVPSMLTALIRSDDSALSKVRTVLVGGGPTSMELLSECESKGISVQPTWGMTEAGSQVATRVSTAKVLENHVGPAMPFVNVTRRGDRFHLDGPLMNEPLLTQDIGQIDAKGRITVWGRVDDVILTSGHKVHPSEVEGHFAGMDKPGNRT